MSIEHPFATLLRLQGRRPDEVIPICTIDPGVKGLNTHWATVTEAPEVADRFAGVSNVFYGIQPTSRPESGRGTSQSVTGLVALFCDLDFSDGKTEGAGIDRLDALDFIDELAGAIGAEPHCVVSTGGGLHPYWMVADDSGDRLDPIDGILLLIRWKQLVGELAARRGIKLDLGVYDLPRIARVPGPNNLKRNPAAPTGLVVRHEGASLRLSDVTAGLDRFVPAVEDSGLRWASGTIREAQEQDGVPRIFTDEQAQAFLEEHAWRRARETPWGAGADFWKVIWECALVASCFIEMYDEDDLREGLRQAIRDGHDGADPDMNDEYQIHLGFIKGRTFSARRPTAAEQTNPFHLAFVAPEVSALRQDWRVSEIQGATDYFILGEESQTAPETSQDQDEDEPWTPHSALAGDGQLVLPEGMVANPFAIGAKPAVGPRPRQETPASDMKSDGSLSPAGYRRLAVQRASSIAPESCDWLWEHDGEFWIPLGGLVLLGGREGVGKSTWTARLVAQVTNGKMAGEFLGKPRSVVISATEDAWPQTIIPRLMAAGADLARVLRVNAIEDDTATGLSLPHDVPALAKLIWDEEVAMVVLDPLLSTIGGTGVALDTHKDSDVRKALEPITLLAADSRATFLGLIHQNKSQGGDLLTRMMGSRAFSAVARAVLVCAEAGEQEEGGAFEVLAEQDRTAAVKPPRSFLFGQLKNNLGPRVETSVRYEIEGQVVGHDAHTSKPIRTSKIKVTSYKDQTTVEDSVMEKEAQAREKTDKRRGAKPESKQTQCNTWLAEVLRGGPMLGSEVKTLAVGLGLGAQLQRAREALGVVLQGSATNPDYALPVIQSSDSA